MNKICYYILRKYTVIKYIETLQIFLDSKFTLTIHTEFLSTEIPKSLSTGLLSIQSSPSLYSGLRISWHRSRTLHLSLWNHMLFTWAYLLSLSRSSTWVSNWTLYEELLYIQREIILMFLLFSCVWNISTKISIHV